MIPTRRHRKAQTRTSPSQDRTPTRRELIRSITAAHAQEDRRRIRSSSATAASIYLRRISYSRRE